MVVLAERNTARWLDLNQTYWSRMSVATDSPRRAAIAALEAELSRGADGSGAPYSAAKRADRRSVIERRRNELAELSTLAVIAPDRVAAQATKS